MKLETLTNKRLWLPVLGVVIIVGLASWDYQQSPSGNRQDQHPTDTIPKKKKAITDRKVRDLDDVINELDAVDLDREMEKVQAELAKAMKEIDGEKIRMQMGTRFVASEEASSHIAFKHAVINTVEGDTILTMKQLTPVRLIRNEFYRKVQEAEARGASPEELKILLGRARAKKGMFEGELEEGELEIGQVSSLLDRILP